MGNDLIVLKKYFLLSYIIKTTKSEKYDVAKKKDVLPTCPHPIFANPPELTIFFVPNGIRTRDKSFSSNVRIPLDHGSGKIVNVHIYFKKIVPPSKFVFFWLWGKGYTPKFWKFA